MEKNESKMELGGYRLDRILYAVQSGVGKNGYMKLEQMNQFLDELINGLEHLMKVFEDERASLEKEVQA